MRLTLKFPAAIAALAVLAGLTAPAQARFVQPFEVVAEPGLKSTAEKLKTLKEPKEAEPIFKQIEAAAASGGADAQFFLGFLYQSGAGTERSVEKAKAAYEKAAAAGSPGAKNNLGLIKLAEGEDPKKSIGLVEEAANAGYSPAQVSMGQLFLDGLPAAGLEKDLDQARVWFERASETGDDDASLTLGIMYEKGAGTAVNHDKAVTLFTKAADAGNTDAMMRLGAKLAAGQGIKTDAAKGLGWFEKAVAANAPGARAALASLYETGAGDEKAGGMAKDVKKAFTLYQEAAEAGDLPGFNKVAFFYEKGIGTEANEAKAAEWYRKGAEKNIPVCLHNLAVFTEEGKGGVKKDAEQAVKLYYRAAVTGFPPSQVSLAVRYREGRGVEKDAQAALAWFERAMQNGHADAAVSYAAMLEAGEAGFVNYETALKIYREAASHGHLTALVGLGGMMEAGRGVQGDYRQAFAFYQAASKGGSKEGTDRLAEIKKRMTPEQLKIAEAFVTTGGQESGKPAEAAKTGTAKETPPKGSNKKPKPAPRPKREQR